MRPISHKYLGVLAGLTGLTALNLEASIQVNWIPSTTAGVAGYCLSWGTNSGIYQGTNYYDATATNATLDFSDNNVYYLAVAAFDSNNIVSPFSNEVNYTNVVASAPPPPNTPPPPPPMPGTNGPDTNVVVTTPPPPSGSNTNTPATPTRAILWGVPPNLHFTMTNAAPMLSVAGTVGATLQVQCSTNPGSPFFWTPVTNISLTNLADIAATNPPANPDALDLAYVPSSQQFSLPASGTSNMLFYRTVMPYDYVVLAGQVLPAKGFPSRLIMVTMPGFSDDACYVTAQSSYIHYLAASNTFDLENSGSTIRQIANNLATTLNQNWTTASEFVYSNGMGQIMATVVKTEDPTTDPVAQGAPTSQININF